MRLLVAEDNDVLVKALDRALTQAGHRVDSVANGIDAELRLRTGEYDVAVLDILLPGKDGISVLRELRESGVSTPILLLSSLADVENRVEGLTSGADDYLTKPFVFGELLARVNALGRRLSTTFAGEKTSRLGAFVLDSQSRQLIGCSGEIVQLRLKEYELMVLLAARRNAVVTRTEIADHIWGSPLGVTDDVINATISSLRRKLELSVQEAQEKGEDAPSVHLETIRGVGYILKVPEPPGNA